MRQLTSFEAQFVCGAEGTMSPLQTTALYCGVGTLLGGLSGAGIILSFPQRTLGPTAAISFLAVGTMLGSGIGFTTGLTASFFTYYSIDIKVFALDNA